MTITQLKQEAVELGITADEVRAFGDLRKMTTWEAAVSVARSEVAMTTLSAEADQTETCETCPNFRQIEGDKGLCCLFDKVGKSYNTKMQDCHNAIATIEADIEPETETAENEIQVEVSGDFLIATGEDAAKLNKACQTPTFTKKGLLASGFPSHAFARYKAIANEAGFDLRIIQPPTKQHLQGISLNVAKSIARCESLLFIDEGWRIVCVNDVGKEYEISDTYCTCEAHFHSRKCYHRQEYLHRRHCQKKVLELF